MVEPEAGGQEQSELRKGAELSKKRIERFKSFPAGILPEPLRRFVVAGAASIGCDASFLALPLLTVLAAAIGNTRRIQLKRGWTAPAIVWTAIVGESGTAKTPAFKLVMKPVRDIQRKSLEDYAAAVKQYETDSVQYDKALMAWKRDKKDAGPPPEIAEPPRAVRYVVSDTTVEALAPLLLSNPRGLLLARDELSGWLGGFDRYAGGKGGTDAANWLSVFNGETIVVDRKTGTPRTINVPEASVSVTGGIQPEILRRALGREHRESGLLARLLLASPPRTRKQWTEDDIDPTEEAELATLVAKLYELEPTIDNEGQPQAVVVDLSAEAKLLWITYYNRHAEEQSDLTGDLSAAWSKLEEYAARFALTIHFARWAAGGLTLKKVDMVDATSMKAGIDLAEWFKVEARRVYAMLDENEVHRSQRRLVEWIERKGGAVTARKVQQGNRQYHTASDAEAALDELVNAGIGAWQDIPAGPKGGRPSRIFRLHPASTSTQPSETRGAAGSVDVDSAKACETPSEPATADSDREDLCLPTTC